MAASEGRYRNLVCNRGTGSPQKLAFVGCDSEFEPRQPLHFKYCALCAVISAAVAHLVERHLAKVEVASSSLVSRSKTKRPVFDRSFVLEMDTGSKTRQKNMPAACFFGRVIRPTAPVGRSLAKSGLDGRFSRFTAGWCFARRQLSARRLFSLLISRPGRPEPRENRPRWPVFAFYGRLIFRAAAAFRPQTLRSSDPLAPADRFSRFAAGRSGLRSASGHDSRKKHRPQAVLFAILPRSASPGAGGRAAPAYRCRRSAAAAAFQTARRAWDRSAAPPYRRCSP